MGSNLYRKKAKKKVKEIAQLRYCGQFISPYQAHLRRVCEKYKTIMVLEKMKERNIFYFSLVQKLRTNRIRDIFYLYFIIK